MNPTTAAAAPAPCGDEAPPPGAPGNRSQDAAATAAPAPAPAPAPRPAKKARTSLNFSDSDDRALFECMEHEERYPICSDDWDRVAADFADYMTRASTPERKRPADALKARFCRLRNVKKPTGDPS